MIFAIGQVWGQKRAVAYRYKPTKSYELQIIRLNLIWCPTSKVAIANTEKPLYFLVISTVSWGHLPTFQEKETVSPTLQFQPTPCLWCGLKPARSSICRLQFDAHATACHASKRMWPHTNGWAIKANTCGHTQMVGHQSKHMWPHTNGWAIKANTCGHKQMGETSGTCFSCHVSPCMFKWPVVAWAGQQHPF